MADNYCPVASIFISYAHEDEELKKELDKYLKVLKRSSKIGSWNDRNLDSRPGMGRGNYG